MTMLRIHQVGRSFAFAHIALITLAATLSGACGAGSTFPDSGADTSNNESGHMDALTDAQDHASMDATEAERDVPQGTDTAADAPADVAPDIVHVHCRTNADCTATPSTPSCNAALGYCTQCLATADTCPAGSYCDATGSCVAGCRTGADCVTSDAGMVCDLASHMCVGCTMDSQCMLGTVCTGGFCVPGCNTMHGCPTGQSCCGGMCIGITDDVMNCGSCAHTCDATNASPVCVAGTCQEHCSAGFGDCDTNPSNGCETSITTTTNCGTCGTACSIPNANAACTAGMCSIASCYAGYVDCDGSVTNGCETNALTDPAHCGGCGTACPPTYSCVAGSCQCAAGQTLCGSTCTNTSGDPLHCGSCTNVCPTGQICASGMCPVNITTYSVTTPPASVVWVDVCSLTSATHTAMGVDDGLVTAATLPFTFRLFDGMYTIVTPSADGYLQFGPSPVYAYYGSFMLPSATAPKPAFFAYSRDLFQRATGECFATIGTAPNRSFVWETNDAYHYADPATDLTFEVFLNEGTNTIDVLYQTLTGTGTDGSQCNVGMQNATATLSYQWEYDTAGRLASGTRLRFNPM